jgi:hypothetical protein
MGFWRKAKRSLGTGFGIAKMATGMMGLMPGKYGQLARMVSPYVDAASKVASATGVTG